MRNRFGVLDGIRGLGALTIVVYHSWPLGQTHRSGVPFGHLAVDLFFVLSGFVISYSYDRRFAGGMTVGQFMTARMVRLYPIFWACALIGAAPFIWEALNGQGSRGRLLVLLLTNMFVLPSPTYPVLPDPFPINSPAWSLFFELFVANLSYVLIWRFLTRTVLIAIIIFNAAWLLIVVCQTGTVDGGSLWMTFPTGFPRVLFSFYMGAFLFRLYREYPPPAFRPCFHYS